LAKLFGLIGHPVAHSLSAVMHNDMFQELGMSHYYHAFDVNPKDVKEAVRGMRALGVSGFNVTVPHKVAVMSELDDIDEEARQIGAVNTVKNENGLLIGYNTDGRGYLNGLKKIAGHSLSNKKILMIGAGGAAKGVAVTLARFGVRRLDITNRTPEKARNLSDICSAYGPSDALDFGKAETYLPTYDILINTTPAGMSPDIEKMPLSVDRVTPGTVMSDLIYNPLKTKWLEKGEGRDAVIDNGISMFVGQGALAFEIWTGYQPDEDRMKHVVLEQLRRRI
jgi:shikimate dehydrogenase